MSTSTETVKDLRSVLSAFGFFSLGVVLILIALVGEAVLEHRERWETMQQVREAVAHPEAAAPAGTHGTSAEPPPATVDEFFGALKGSGWHIFFHLLRDIGIALIVSVLLIVLLERANRKVLEEEFEERLKKVTTRTIDAVYGNEHPQEVFQAIGGVLEGALLREGFDVTITLWRLDTASPLASDGAREAVAEFMRQAQSLGEDCSRLVAMQVETRYVIRNVGSSPTTWRPPFMTERYFQASTAQTCRVESVRVGKRLYTAAGCRIGSTFDETKPFTIRKDGNSIVCEIPDKMELAKGGREEIEFNGFAIRRIHDDEVWCSSVLTKHMVATLIDYTDQNLDLEVQSLCGQVNSENNFGPDRPRRVKVEEEGCVLPFQSFVLSWGPGVQNREARRSQIVKPGAVPPASAAVGNGSADAQHA